MFKTKEEEARALKGLQDSVKRFNDTYRVSADFNVFLQASNRKTANAIFVDSFKGLLKEAIQNSDADKFKIIDMRVAFERYVVDPYRSYSTKKANENEVNSVQKKLPDTNAGLTSNEWWRQIDREIDGIYWEKVDRVATDYKNGSPRIRDMVAEAKRITGQAGDLSQDDAQKLASYAAALRRTNESRPGILKFFLFVRSNAEQREAANIEKMLNEKMGDPNAYQNAIKALSDPTGKLEGFRGQTKKAQDFKLNFSDTNEKSKQKAVEKPKAPQKEEKKEPLSVEDLNNAPQKIEEEKRPGNDRLYRLIGDKRFETKIKDEIWKVLKLKESNFVDKNEKTDLFYKPLLENAKSLNETYAGLSNDGADINAVEELLGDEATAMFTQAYFILESFNLGPEDRIIAAQKIADTMLNQLTVIGFEKDQFGEYGKSYAVKNETAVFELFQMEKNPLPQETGARLVRSAKKELAAAEKERVEIPAESDSRKDMKLGAKHEEQPKRDTLLNK